PTEDTQPEEPVEPEQPENVTVPSVVGMESRAARAQLEAAGLKVRITEEFSDQQPRGFVISQSSMSEVPPGSTIALVVSKGTDPGQQPTDPPDPENPDPSPTETGPPGGGGNGGG